MPESADWYESTYMIVWGTNLPMTRTPDAHFFTEARYRGAKVTAVAPDYAEYVKFADNTYGKSMIFLGAGTNFLKHLLGVDNAVQNAESELRPEDIKLREPAPQGKLDLLVTLELRMSTSAMYSDIVLPSAGWYEMHDLSTTDMPPFIHPFNPAVDPPWEAKTSWDQFSAIAEKFSELAAIHLGEMKDLVATPLLHDSPGEIAQSEMLDWRKGAKYMWFNNVETKPGIGYPKERENQSLHKGS